MTSGFFKKSFFINIIFLEILLLDLELVFLEFKHIFKTQRTSLFFYLFIFCLLFCNHSVLITLSTFWTWTGSLKWTPLPCQFSRWSLNFSRLSLLQMKLECLNCQKSDVRTNSTCCSVLLCTSFCFLQVNQQKHVGMLSTNNIMYSEQISKYFW